MSKRPRAFAAAIAACSISLFGATAHAQYAAPPPVTGAQPVYVQQQQPVYVQQQPQRIGRFRYGIDGGAGWTFIGPLSGFGITGSLRLGWQINDNWAVYYQGDIPIGFVGGEVGTRSYAGASLFIGTGIMGEYTLGDILSFGLGPSLDYGLGGACSSAGDCYGGAGTAFGIQARIAVTLVAASSGAESRRRGFRVGVSSHTTFLGDVFQAINLHLGYEWF